MGAIRDRNYYLVVDGYEWTTARTNAQNLGGDLVVIHSSAENDFLVSNFRSEITLDWRGGERGGAWIGLNQNTEWFDREWVDGTEISYTNYGQGGGQDKASLPYHGGYLLLMKQLGFNDDTWWVCLLYTSPSPRDTG